MTKEEFCKELKESQEKGILFVCSIAQKYVNSLEAENERLKAELEMEQDDCINATKCEIEYHKAYEKELDENVKLRKENERLKAENIMLRSAGLKQTLEHEQIFKDFIKENAKLKCLALHGMIGYATCKMNLAAEKYKDDEMSAFAVPIEFSKWHRKEIEWAKAYRKAKQALREGK